MPDAADTLTCRDCGQSFTIVKAAPGYNLAPLSFCPQCGTATLAVNPAAGRFPETFGIVGRDLWLLIFKHWLHDLGKEDYPLFLDYVDATLNGTIDPRKRRA